MPLRLSPSIARVRREERLNYLDVNLNFVDGDVLTCARMVCATRRGAQPD